MYAFHNKMILLVRLNRDFMRKNPVLALGFEPTSFQLISTCQGITRLASLHLFELTTNTPLFLHWVDGPPFYKVGFLQPPLKSFQVCPNLGPFWLNYLSFKLSPCATCVTWCNSKAIISLLLILALHKTSMTIIYRLILFQRSVQKLFLLFTTLLNNMSCTLRLSYSILINFLSIIFSHSLSLSLSLSHIHTHTHIHTYVHRHTQTHTDTQTHT